MDAEATDGLALLALEHNLVLSAGAGAGKTHALVTLALHLLAGARAGAPPLPPARLCLLTFTEKAAAELRERLAARVEALARGEAAAEPELAASFAARGAAVPGADAWRRVRDGLPDATVGTFHSLCAQLLRRAPPGVGPDPAFEVLDELEARALRREVCERVVLEALEPGEGGAPRDAAARELVLRWGFAGGRVGEGLVDALEDAFVRLREEGLRAEALPTADPAAARADAEARLDEARQLARALRDEDAEGAWAPLAAGALAALEGATVDTLRERARLPALEALMLAQDARKLGAQRKGPGLRARALRRLVLGGGDVRGGRLRDALAALEVAPWEAGFRRLLEAVEAQHARALARRGGLDFAALLFRARDLLRDVPAFRRFAQERVGALLVDEFQDTNALQLELVALLAEQREGAPRALPAGAGTEDALVRLPLEDGLLCVVGDRKQSIYDFRGADAAVFGRLTDAVLAQGGRRALLRHSRRASAPLLEAVNRAAAHVLAAPEAPRPFDVAYRPGEDDLLPVRTGAAPGPAVERLVVAPEGPGAGALRAADAEAVARRLAALLAPDAGVRVERRGEPGRLQPLRGGDVAVLLRTFSQVELYRQALVRHGVPHRVLRGRGFYGAQEVLDLASLLSLLADPEDALAFAALLRSPLVGLSDGALLRLAGPEARLAPDSPRLADVGGLGLPADEALRLQRLLGALPALRRERDRLGVRPLLQAAMDVTGFREALAASPYAEQALANVDKLLALAERRDARGPGGGVAFARELRALVEAEPTEAQAELLGEDDPRAVQLLTVHRAKGLEWPVVVLPGLGTRRRASTGPVRVDRARGVALRPWLPDGLEELEERPTSARFEAARAEQGAREEAEYRRLLYVALTRARDRLVLCGAAEARTSGTWWHLLDAALARDTALRAAVVDVDAAALPAPAPPPAPPPPGPAAAARVDAALERVRGARPLAPLAPVDALALQDFVRCPERYRLRHLVGARPGPDAAWEAVAPLDVREEDGFGERTPAPELAARLLAHLDVTAALRPAAERRAHLEDLARAEGWEPDAPEARGAVDGLARWLGTDFARRVAAAPGGLRRHAVVRLALGGPADAAVDVPVDWVWQEAPGAPVYGVRLVAARAHPLGVRADEVSLGALAAALAGQYPEGTPVHAGLAWLGEAHPEPQFLPAPEPAAVRATLAEAARALREAEARGAWPGRGRGTCQALFCGFAERCHSGAGPC